MGVDTKRMIDDGGPFVLWAPSDTCHGLFVETDLLVAGEQADVVGLLLRPAHSQGYAKVEALGEPIRGELTLSTGHFAPIDDTARHLIEHYPWFHERILERLEWLRQRVARAALQTDRDSSYRAALATHAEGTLLPYDRMFPADWDLLVADDGHSYWAVDLHCLNPTCTCEDVVVQLYDIAEASSLVGEIRRHRHRAQAKPKASSPLAARLFVRLWSRHRPELERRFDEVRSKLRAQHPANVASEPEPLRQPTRVPRNAPCPCGSGKKYKRCCAGRERQPEP